MIKSLRLRNFRSYSDKSFEFNQGANIIVGPNAIGKTNILEAILVSRVGSSYRTKDNELIAFKKPWATNDSLDDGSTRLIKIERDKMPSKTMEINGHIYKRMMASLRLPVVLFEPNHLQLLNGSPEGRRNYLDGIIEQVEPEYGPIVRKYQRALSQRNSLLKQPNRPSINQLFPWNIRMSQLGGQIVRQRSKMAEIINQSLPLTYKKLSGSTLETALLYKPQFAVETYESQYLKKLESEIADDLRSGFTTYGPHRDDFSFLFNGHVSNNYASRGELRTAVLALKVSELQTIKERTDKSPIMLLDDVYSELDSARRKALTSFLKSDQSFITTTDADLVLKQLAGKNKIIKL